MYSCLYAAHQRNRAVLLLVVEEERTVRKPADKVIAPVLLDIILPFGSDFQNNAFAAHLKMIVVPLDLHTYNLPPDWERRTDFGTSAESEKDGRLPE